MIYGPLVKSVITPACHAGITGSSPVGTANLGVVQSGRILALGASGRRFKSYRRDHYSKSLLKSSTYGASAAQPKCLILKGFLLNRGAGETSVNG